MHHQQIPNVLGFIFGMLQMLLYAIYRKPRKSLEKPTLGESSEHVIDVSKLGANACCELNTEVAAPKNENDHEEVDDNHVKEQPKKIKEDKDLSDTV